MWQQSAEWWKYLNFQSKDVFSGAANASWIKASTNKADTAFCFQAELSEGSSCGSSAKLKAPRAADKGTIMAGKVFCTKTVSAKPTLSSVVGHESAQGKTSPGSHLPLKEVAS